MNTITSLVAKRHRVAAILFLLSAVAAISSRATEPPKRWTTAFHWERETELQYLFDLGVLTQDDKMLVGDFFLNNRLNEKEQSNQSLVIKGSVGRDGTFWPFVDLFVRSKGDTNWTKISSTPENGTSAEIRVYPGMNVLGLRVNMDPFKPFLSDSKRGRVALKSGEASDFPLHDLLPPTEGKSN